MIADSVPSGPRGYRAFYSTYHIGQGHHGGTALLVRNDISHNVLQIHTPLQAVAVRVFLNRPYTVCSIYLPPSVVVQKEDLARLVHDLPSPLILLGDFNGRHPLWGDCTVNPRGVLVASLIEEEELGVFNSEDMTYFHSPTGTFTAIDISLCSSDALLDFNWRVMSDLHGSDHFPIVLETAESEPQSRLPRWKLDRADWHQFKELCSPVCSVADFGSSDEAVTYFTDRLHSAALQSVPRTSGHFPKRPVPWWTPACSAAVRAKRAAFSRLCHHRDDPYCLQAFRRARARARRVLKEARRASWKAYVSSITARTPITQVFNRVRKISGKFSVSPPPVLSQAGAIVSDPKVVANTFADHFAKVSKKDHNCPMAHYRQQLESIGVNFNSRGGESYNALFSISEFETALSQCHDSSPGHDDITYAFLRHMSDEARSYLLELYNLIWNTGDFPFSWSVATIIPIPKPGKDHLLATNYRPISLTSCICKVMEKMVNARLMWYLERGNYLSPVQYGFRKVRSTTDALLSLESSVCEAFASKQHHVSVFFDLEKAYDTAWRHGILTSLFEFGLRGRLPVFIERFLSQRSIRVRVGGVLSEAQLLEEGVPQGSILSVTLFAVAINSVISVLPDGVRGSLYVDDLSISFSAARMPLVERKLQLAINRISEWATTRGFRFSASKTVAMHFCRLRGIHPDPNLYLYDRRISCVEETRFLGVIFDSRLTWVPHLRHIKITCMKALSLLRVLAHTSWGADRQTLLLLHRSLVLSKLEYGCELYSSATEARLRVLNSVHHAGVRLATGGFRSSPIPSLLVDAGVLPLDLRRQSLLLRCWYRVHRLPDSLTSAAVSRDFRSQLHTARPSFPKPFGFRVASTMEVMSVPSHPVCSHRFPRIGFWQLPRVSVCSSAYLNKKLISQSHSLALFLEHTSNHSDSIPVYTDGSKSDHGAGYGVVFPSLCRGGSLPRVSSVFTAELSAIVMALQIIFTLPVSSFIIYTDSRSALSALESFTSSLHPLVLSILEWLYILKGRGYNVNFCWVPAHVGVTGNERADRLAKEAATRAPPACPVPYSDMFSAIRLAVHACWQRSWEAVAAVTKMGEITVAAPPPWTYAHVSGRRHETALARLRIGHTKLTHSYLMSGGVQPYCDDCLVPLTVRHFLAECPSLGDLRERYLSRCRGEDGVFRLSLMLGGECLSPGHEVLRFVERAGLLHKL